MSRQIPLLGYIGDIKEDGSYDVTVKTADGIEVGKYEMSAEGKPIEKEGNKYYGFYVTGAGVVVTINGKLLPAGDEGYLQTTILAKVGDTIKIEISSDHALEDYSFQGCEEYIAGTGLSISDDYKSVSGTLVGNGGFVVIYPTK